MNSIVDECDITCETLMQNFERYTKEGRLQFKTNDEVTRCLQVLETHCWGIHSLTRHETSELSHPRESYYKRKERESDEFFEMTYE